MPQSKPGFRRFPQKPVIVGRRIGYPAGPCCQFCLRRGGSARHGPVPWQSLQYRDEKVLLDAGPVLNFFCFYSNIVRKEFFMRKYLVVFVTLVSVILLSCFNFAMPKEVHVKAGINPNIPVNSESFNFSKEFQNELNKLFTGGADGGSVKIFDYTGDDDNIQKFLISFPIKEQSLDFADYFSKDLDMDSSFQAINQTFTLDPLSDAENNKISIDMSSTIDDILGNIVFPPVSAPVAGRSGDLPSIPINVTGFTSLSFYEGDLKVTFSLPAGQSDQVTLRNLKVNSISSSTYSYDLTTYKRSVEVLFPLEGKTLDKPLSLSFSYTADTPVNLNAEIGFSDNVKLKTAKGVSFESINNKDLGKSNTIDPGLPPEFVQAVIAAGSVSLDKSAIKGADLNLEGIKLQQDANAEAPLYKGQSLSDGLDNPLQSSLAGKKINLKPINIKGSYSLAVLDQNNTEITFTKDETLEIPVSFSLNEFSKVYVSGEKIIDDFNNGDSSTINISLASLGETVSLIKIEEVGVELTFEQSRMEGLNLKITSEKFMVKQVPPIPIKPPGKGRFTNLTSIPKTENFEFDVASNKTVQFDLELSGSGDVLELTSVVPGTPVPIIDCTPEVIFEWVEATIDLNQGSDGEDNTLTKGTFPQGSDSFSLDGKDLKNFLTNLEFDKIDGYLFFSAPDGFGNNMSLSLTAFPNTSDEEQLYNDKIERSKPLFLPENEEPFTGKIGEGDLKGSHKDPILFTPPFNAMLPTQTQDGKPLSIGYNIDLGGTLFTVKKTDVEDGGAATIKADLVLILPLKLEARTGGAEIDVTEYLGGMKGKNLLSFAENTGQTDISFNTLTLNVNMTGAPITGGQLEIERNTHLDGTNEQIKPIDLKGKNISIPLADYLGASQKFTIDEVKLVIEAGGSLEVPRGLSLLSIGVDAGIDATFGL
jgi:hypothetical protein